MIHVQRLLRHASLALLLGALALTSSNARAGSSLDKTVEALDEATVKGYIQPIADLFGANMQSGWFHSAEIPVTGFNFTFSLVGMGGVVGNDQKTYSAPSPFGGTYETATVFGEQGGVATGPGGLQYAGPSGVFKTSIFPLATPQIRVGSVYGTEATLRWLPTVKAGDVGEIKFFGIGARHNISQYLSEVPLDLAAGFAYSTFSVGDKLDFTGISIGAQASKKFAILSVYGGLAWEKTKLNLKYVNTTTNTNVNLDLDGANKFRATIGAGLDLFILTLFADANFGSVTVFSGGLAFGF